MKYLYLKFYDYHDLLSRYYVKLINCEDDTYYCSFVNGENIDENLDNSEEIEEEDYFVLAENSENKDLLKKIFNKYYNKITV